MDTFTTVLSVFSTVCASGLTTSKNEWIKQSNTSGGGGFPAASSLQRRVQQ